MSRHGTSRMGSRFFYPHKFYVGRVIDLPVNGNPSLKFLDPRPRDVFEYRSDKKKNENTYLEGN